MSTKYIVKISKTGLFEKAQKNVFYAHISQTILFLFKDIFPPINKPEVYLIYYQGLNIPLNYQSIFNPTDFSSQIDLSSIKNLMNLKLERGHYQTDFIIENPGVITFQILFKNSKNELSRLLNSDTIISHPNIKINNQLEPKQLEFSGLNLITLFPSMIGHFNDWEQEFIYLIERGYFAFHLSPIQAIGQSNSLYSISDHLAFNQTIFEKETTYHDLAKTIQNLKKKNNLFFMIDMIWNHCSVDAEWLIEETNCYYNIQNSPHLNAAFVIDQFLFFLSENPSLFGFLKDNEITKSEEINKICDFIYQKIHSELKILEYFQINIDQFRKDAILFFKKHEKQNLSTFSNISENVKNEIFFKCFSNLGASKNGVLTDFSQIDSILNNNQLNLEIESIINLAIEKNKQQAYILNNWISELLQNLHSEITYRFINNPTKYKITSQYPLVSRYFYLLKNKDYALLNGFVSGYSSKIDFSKSPDQPYLRRNVIIWSDLIKLNYQTIDICPKLWSRMTEYTIQMAHVFDGFRLDNFHNSNIPAAKHFISKALEINPSLFILSELFTNIAELDAFFVNQVGIHKVVRELQNFSSLNDLIGFSKYYLEQTGRIAIPFPTRKKNQSKVSTLEPVMPPPLIYDQSHDNHTYSEKYHSSVQLPILAIENYLFMMIGTNRGFDEGFSHHIPVTCQEKYPKPMTDEKYPLGDFNSVLIITNSNDLSSHFSFNINKIELFCSYDDWQNPIQMSKSSNNDFSCRINLKTGTFQFKFRINDHFWDYSLSKKIAIDQFGNKNNEIDFSTKLIAFDNLVFL